VRRASTGASVNAAKKRESAEREGNRSRSRPGHERDGKRLDPLVELLQRAFAADGIAEKDREKIEDFVVSETPSCKTHMLTDLGQDALRGVGTRQLARLRQARTGARERTRTKLG
jgi:hypothetical protein